MSIFRPLYAVLGCLLGWKTNVTFSDSEDETEETPPLGSRSTGKCHHDDLSSGDGDDTFVVKLPSALLKDPVRLTSPRVTVETTEVYAESFSDEDLEGVYHELFSVGPDLVPHIRTAEWFSEGDGFLAELIRREGRGTHTTGICYSCGGHLGGEGHRCMDCFDDALYCASCIVSSHVRLCLHRIQTWNGKFFDGLFTLTKLGLRVQLGHPVGERCSSPLGTPHGNTFTVIDNTGLHKVAVDYCGCENAIQPYLQLLHHGWFPSSSIQPSIAVTFSLLSHFQILASQSNVTALEFYKSLSRITDNTGMSQLKDFYPSFLLIVNQWCRIKSMKRAGRGNDPGGIAATPAGAGVVECPACPHPGLNTPEAGIPPAKSRDVDASSKFKRKKTFCSHLDSAELDVASDSRSERKIHGDIDLPLNTSLSQVKARTVWEKITSCAAPVFRLNACYETCPSVYSSDNLPVTTSIHANGESGDRSGSLSDSFRISAKETVRGSHQCPLNDVSRDRDWYKITTIPEMYLYRIEAAAREREVHSTTFKTLNELVVAKQKAAWSAMKKTSMADEKYPPDQYEVKYQPLHSERSKTRTHAQKSDEQVQHLLEEMRRVVMFHKRKAEWWEDQLGRTFLEQPQYFEGANAYAHRQAAIRRAMGSHCLHSWRFVSSYVACGNSDAGQLLYGDNDLDVELMSHADLPSDFDFLTSDILQLTLHADSTAVF